MQKYFIGATPYLEVLVKIRETGVLVDASSVACTVEDSTGAVIVDSAAMTKTATGTYKYVSLTLTSAHIPGVWRWRPEVTDTAIITIAYEGEFEVMPR